LCNHPHTPGKLIEKCFDVIGTGLGMPQFLNAEVMFKRALHLWGYTERMGHLPVGKARRTCVGACVGSYIPYETGHPVEGQPNLGKVIELTMNMASIPARRSRSDPRPAIPRTSRTSKSCTRPSSSSSVLRGHLRRGAWIASMLNAEVLPVAWRSILTGGCIETGKEVWEGGANYYTVAQISVAGVDAANSLMAVKKLVFDDKKLDHGRAEEGPGGQLRRGIRTGREDVLRRTQAWQRHP